MNIPQHLTTSHKAQIINEDSPYYGTFAEIGAGQEVARHFFLAGHASRTIAKTMSAYDMSFSDAIYGKCERYVSQSRLTKMLEHEYELVLERLDNKEKLFFAFANTVATSSHNQSHHGHAWMGVRFQTKEGGPSNEIHIHVQAKDNLRLQQQEALGILGVNLIYACCFHLNNIKNFISSLTDNLDTDRFEMDYINLQGEDLQHINKKEACLELLAQGYTNALIFCEDGEIKQSSDFLYGKPVLVQRGTYQPITNVNIEILENAHKQFSDELHDNSSEIVSLFEFTIKEIDQEGYDFKKDLARIETINAAGLPVMVSNYPLFYELKNYLRKCTSNHIVIVMGASLLPALFEEKYYKHLVGGILNAFGMLFDERTQVYIYPYKSETQCLTKKSFFPELKILPLFQYLSENDSIVDIYGCDDVNTSIHSEVVRKLLSEGNPDWKKYVPEKVSDLIEKNQWFGFKKC